MQKDFDVYWTQAEVAKRWKCTESTVKNYRDRGLLPCFQPGSLVRYLKKDIIEFEKKHTINLKGGDKLNRANRIKKELPVVSAKNDDDWRI
jgi:hypothetical protein